MNNSKMTANNKIDLLVSPDGTVKPLLVNMTQRNQSLQKRTNKAHRLVGFILAFLFIVFALFIGFKAITKPHVLKISMSYKMHYVTQNSWKGGKMEFSENEAISAFTSENVVTLSDGLAQITVVKINTSTPGLPSSICMVRDDEDYGTGTPRVLPKADTMDLLMTESVSNKRVEMVMTEDVWVPDVYDAVDFEHLPLSVKILCEDTPVYKMILKEEDEQDDDDDDDDYDRDEYAQNDVVEESDVIKEQKLFQNNQPPVSDDETKEWNSREKRAINEDEEEKEIDDEQGPDDSDRFGPSQSDHELNCCNHCRRPYMQCSHVCVPIQQLTYPYYYRSCQYIECSVLYPCVWWRAAAGYRTP